MIARQDRPEKNSQRPATQESDTTARPQYYSFYLHDCTLRHCTQKRSTRWADGHRSKHYSSKQHKSGGPMKLAIVLAVCSLVTVNCPRTMSRPVNPKAEIVFEGIVLKISPPVAVSGRISAYRLVKYRLEKVCKGKYEQAD